MKDNTAQIVAQVPVDVATFLLNEKRTDVLTIETRFKVNVLLVPNRHLETPNYSIERLRHDELNVGEPLPASFDMVQQPEQVDLAKQKKEEASAPRQEAVVKGITPAQPAPVPAARPAPEIRANEAMPAGGTWFSRIMDWFRVKPEARAPTVAAPTREQRPVDRNRDPRRDSRGGEQRDRPRGDGRRGGEQRDGGRGEGRDRRESRAGNRDARADGQRREPPPRSPQQPVHAQREDRRDGKSGAPREQREGQRPPRPPRGAGPVATDATDNAMITSAMPAAANTTPDLGEAGGRRRRGRRGRGGERTPEAAGAIAGNGASANEPTVADVVEIVVGAGLPEDSASMPKREPRAPRPPRDAREPRDQRQPREPREQREPRESRAVGEQREPPSGAPGVPERPALKTTPPVAAAAVPASADQGGSAMPAIEPVPPVARPASIEAPPIALTLPPDSNLVLIETRHVAAAPSHDEPAPPRPKRVRPPRVETATEPLEFVETRKEPTPPAD